MIGEGLYESAKRVLAEKRVGFERTEERRRLAGKVEIRLERADEKGIVGFERAEKRGLNLKEQRKGEH